MLPTRRIAVAAFLVAALAAAPAFADATFAPPAITPQTPGTNPGTMAAVQLGAAKQPALVTANRSSGAGNVDLFVAGAAGALAPATALGSLAGGSDAYDVIAADFTNDGIDDLVVASGALTFYKGKADGTFSAPATIAGEVYLTLAAGKFNADGNLDFVADDGSAAQVFSGAGNGAFFRPGGPGATGGASRIAAGDFNGDGTTDVAMGSEGDGDVYVLLGDGLSSFVSPSTPTRVDTGEQSALRPTIGDVDGDGRADIVIGSYGGFGAGSQPPFVKVVRGNGDGTFRAPAGIPAALTGEQIQHVAIADFDGDEKADLALSNQGDGTVRVLLGDGTGTGYTAAGNGVIDLNPVSGTQPSDVVATDLNGDHNLDLGLPSYDSGAVVLLANPPATQFGSGDFGFVVIGQSADRTIAVTNTGGPALRITGASIAGAGAGDFAIVADTCPARLPARGSCAITVRLLAGAGAGAHGAVLHLDDNGPGGEHEVPLGATVVIPPSVQTVPVSQPTPTATPIVAKITPTKLSLGAIRKAKGLGAFCSADTAGKCRVTVTISASDAKRLKLKVAKGKRTYTLGTASATLKKTGAAVKVKLGPTALKALNRLKKGSLKLTFTATVTATGRVAGTAKATLSVRR